MFHWLAITSGPRLHCRPLPRRAALNTGAPFEWQRLGRKTNFCLISRSHSVDEKQSRNSILTEWIGMGRSGPQITAKRQLLDCVTLTMVLLSLLFRPGKWYFFLYVLLRCSPACKAASRSPTEKRWKKLTFSWRRASELRLFNHSERLSHTVTTVFNVLVFNGGETSLLFKSTLSTAGTK